VGVRHTGRKLALKTLYALEMNEANDELQFVHLPGKEEISHILETVFDIEDEQVNGSIWNFARFLTNQTIQNLPIIDNYISEHSIDWKIGRLAVMDRAVLRLAIAEMLYSDTPPKIVMDEAIELAKEFSMPQSGKFINGILDSIFKLVVRTEGKGKDQ